jgi:hypothetical protein
MSEVKCYNCGKAVQDEDLTMKNVSTGYFSSERKPFHNVCWKKYHATKIKKDAIEYVALADGGFLILSILLVTAFSGIASFAILGATIAILIGLGYTWFKLEK